MALNAPLRALIDHVADLLGTSGKGDAAVLIEEVDAAYARLAAQVLDHVQQAVAVVVQHLVARAAEDYIRHALGGLAYHVARIGALHAQV